MAWLRWGRIGEWIRGKGGIGARKPVPSGLVDG